MATGFVDGNSKSPDWQLHESGIAVWPIGSFEQHGHHLPLATDDLQVGYFARFVAEELGAALLPVLPFGNALEHAGFRGTITLTPELLMALVEHIATELEAQNFHTLLVMNGHGGNFALAPKVRQLNRQDRPIKLILVNYWEHFPPVAETMGLEVHSGERETSVMLALFPELVGTDRRDRSPSTYDVPFAQADLNTFGVGRMNPDGVWGYPSKASRELGLQLIEGCKPKLMAWLRARLERLAEDRRYAGPGPVALRPLTPADIPFGMSLKEQAGWNQTEADWGMLLEASEGGSFVALHNGKAAGTVTTVTYQDHFSWLGMMLVDPALRRRGIGERLLEAAVDFARTKGPVRLDATPLGSKLYDSLGFKAEGTICRYLKLGGAKAGKAPAGSCVKLTEDLLAAVARYDAPVFGADREVILKHLHQNAPAYACCVKQAEQFRGYCLGRHGSQFEQLGPLVAADFETARCLLLYALDQCQDQDVIVDVPAAQKEWRAFLEDLGFVPQRSFTRMFLGELEHPGQPDNQYAIAGPELG